MKLVITGAECTGKTSLCQHMHSHEGWYWLAEYCREFVVQQGRAITYADVLDVARAQLARERAAEPSKVTLFDTSLLNTLVYSEFYFNKVPAEIMAWWQGQQYTHHFVCDAVDIVWQDEPLQRAKDDMRATINLRIVEYLEASALPFTYLRGTLCQRAQELCKFVSQQGVCEF